MPIGFAVFSYKLERLMTFLPCVVVAVLMFFSFWFTPRLKMNRVNNIVGHLAQEQKQPQLESFSTAADSKSDNDVVIVAAFRTAIGTCFLFALLCFCNVRNFGHTSNFDICVRQETLFHLNKYLTCVYSPGSQRSICRFQLTHRRHVGPLPQGGPGQDKDRSRPCR